MRGNFVAASKRLYLYHATRGRLEGLYARSKVRRMVPKRLLMEGFLFGDVKVSHSICRISMQSLAIRQLKRAGPQLESAVYTYTKHTNYVWLRRNSFWGLAFAANGQLSLVKRSFG
jgi:hypothetical protein